MQRDPDPTHPLGPDLLRGIGAVVTEFLDGQAALVAEVAATPLLDLARTFTSGGKRLRPAFCYWAHVAAAGFPSDHGALLRAAASLDLLHVSALVHDDLIDASDTRRGVPSSHRQFEAFHTDRGGRGAAEPFGQAAAILLGDLLLMWSVELFDTSGLPAATLERARGLLAAMRTEVTCGQFLDVSAAFGVAGATDPSEELAVAQKVLEFKSARYSVRRPAQIGAALGGAAPELDAALGEFGSLIGRAFQLRDDVLGVFGDADATGKPTGGDIVEGKRTVLVLTALAQGTGAQRSELEAVLAREGADAQDVDAARDIIEATGARGVVEDLITRDTERALAILDGAPMTDAGRTALARLAELSVQRDR